MNPYEILGVKPDATQEQIKKAYRTKAQKAHPDKHGGNTEEFQAIQKAYEILRDPERRAMFDRTGSTEEGQETLVQMAIKELIPMFFSVVQNANSKKEDIVGKVKKQILEHQTRIVYEGEMVGKSIERLNEIKRRLKFNSDKENFFEMALNFALKEEKEKGKKLKIARALLKQMEELVDGYSYDFDPQFITTPTVTGAAWQPWNRGSVGNSWMA